MKNKGIIFVLLSVLVLGFICCSNRNELLGKWQNEETTIEFLNDGNVVTSSLLGDLILEYEIIDDGRLKFSGGIFGLEISPVVHYKIVNDILYINQTDDSTGDLLVLRRYSR